MKDGKMDIEEEAYRTRRDTIKQILADYDKAVEDARRIRLEAIDKAWEVYLKAIKGRES